MKRKTKTCQTCPGGPRELLLEHFGKDDSRPDKRNVRCRDCVRRISAERRAAARTGRALQVRKYTRRRVLPADFVFDTGRDLGGRFVPLVLGAIDAHGGRVSQGEILEFAVAKLPRRLRADVVRDQVGEALGELFQARAIATRGEAEGRIYFRRGYVRRW